MLFTAAKRLTDEDLEHPIKWETNQNPRSTDIIACLSKKQLWKQLGHNFRVDVDGIQIDNKKKRDEKLCSRLVFDQWRKGQLARGKHKDERPCVWATVISALRETQEKAQEKTQKKKTVY